ncbi:MAG: exodeoxyribonuclease VII small subunit [Nitrospinae bacterium]|nr:exodeoxyribonuclease VII small subunit [Nitrospinota bacterium]
MGKIKYEDALVKLESIVSHLENDDIELEDALNKFEEGIKMAKECSSQLDAAEKKINLLTTDLEGSFKTETFKVSGGEKEFLQPEQNSSTNEEPPF